MKLVSINLGNFGSTGRIMIGISNVARTCGFTTYQAYPNSESVRKAQSNDIILCSTLLNKINRKLAHFTGLNGCFAVLPTLLFLRKLDKIQPDIIHFHNLHNSYINLPLLFNYVKKRSIKIVWTLHDCWAFTGHCPHFELIGCDKWKTGCGKCRQLDIYPETMIDTTALLWKLKKKWFTGVENLTVVTPSRWLADLVKQSFLKDYPIKVINNGIDLSVFKPTDSNFRERYKVSKDKFIVLGVAFGWGVRKGLDIFVELAKRLDGRFQIVLVGTDDKVDKQLPDNIISIHRTQNQKELAEIYTAADLFVNPTREDNFPTVNIEALACGTPVLTFRTGGAPEITDDNSGCIVDCGDVDAMENEIIRICSTAPFTTENCIHRAGCFDMWEKFDEYVVLYRNLKHL